MNTLPEGLSLRRSVGIDALDVRTFYAIAQLRERVFVVEQQCPYLELDGRDLEPSTVQLWAETGEGGVVACVRILSEESTDGGTLRVIGRVVTAREWRGTGVATTLMRAALEECRGEPVELNAQSYLSDWYGALGFARNGQEFVEDGIPHTPMRREAE